MQIYYVISTVPYLIVDLDSRLCIVFVGVHLEYSLHTPQHAPDNIKEFNFTGSKPLADPSSQSSIFKIWKKEK